MGRGGGRKEREGENGARATEDASSTDLTSRITPGEGSTHRGWKMRENGAFTMP
jgi:hypothetical protein